jgi:hypothetical protein
MPEFLKLPGVDRAMIAKIVAGYLVITGILGICGGALLFIGGAAAGVGAVIGGSAGGLSEFSQAALEAAATQGTMSESEFASAQATMQAGLNELQAASQEIGGLAGISAMLICFGILSVVTGPLSIIVGVGLFMRQRWSRMGTVIVAGLAAVTGLVGIVSGNGIGNILWLLLAAFVAYFFYTDPEIKDYLEGKTKPAM